MKERQLNDGHRAIYRNPGFGPNALFCPTVGNINGGAWKFCSACGKPLSAIEGGPNQ